MITVPLCGFIFYYYVNTLSLYKEQELKHYKHMIQQIKKRTEDNVNQFNGFMLQISYEANMLRKREQGIEGKEITEKLLNYKLMNPLIYEIILYYHHEDVLYTSQYATQVANFTPHFYPFKHWNADDFYNEMNSIKEKGIKKKQRMDGEGYDEFVTFLYPLEDREAKEFGTLLILVEESKLYDMVQAGLDSNCNLFIIGENNQLISTYNNVSYLSDYNYLNILDYLAKKENQEIFIDEKKNFIIDLESEELGWHFIIMGSTKSLTQDVMGPVLITVKIFCVCITTLFITLSISVFYDSRYVKRLHLRITEYSVNSSIDKQAIQDSLDSLLALKEKDILGRILYEELDEQQVVDLFQLIGLELSGEFYGTCVITADNVLSENIVNSFMNNSAWECRYLIMKKLLPTYHILIYETNQDINYMENVFNDLKASSQSITYMSIGRHTKKVSEIRNSYEEALEGLAWKGQGVNDVVHKHKLLCKSQDFYPSVIMQEIKDAIDEGDVNRIKKEMEALYRHIKRYDTPDFIVKSMFFTLINQLTGDNENIKQTVMTGKMHKYLEGAYEGNDRLFLALSVLTEYCGKVNHKKKTSQDFLEDMKTYIKSNMDNPNFSLSMMASYFAVSLSYASRFFKKSMGMTAQEYLQQCRMDVARELLLTTDLHLKDIAEQVGYYNVSSFIRIFKKYYHQTPGQFRHLVKN